MAGAERTTPIGLARYAREYFDSAIAVDEHLGQRQGYEFVAPMPAMFLIAHSIELALKSYLLWSGCSLRRLRSLGHNLEECWKKALEQGVDKHVTLSDVDLEILKLIGELHSSTELRYIETGFKTFPMFGPLEDLAEKILHPICPLVGYK
jgi:hypothetical protein